MGARPRLHGKAGWSASKCGGSDGFSGITANPTIGAFSDHLIRRGGTTILTEVPEMFGAETLLMDRCESEAVFWQTVSLINNFKQYFTENHQTVYENPSPGNKQGGITTLEDKSLGCTQKSGSAPVVDVLPYAHRVEKAGAESSQRPGERSGSRYGVGCGRGADRAVFHRQGHALCLPRAHGENRQQSCPGPAQGRLD